MDNQVITPQKMRKLDDQAISHFGIPAEVLMERAGLAVALIAEKMLLKQEIDEGFSISPRKTLKGKSVIVLCGKGNNGGDGFVVARILYQLGASVKICLVAGFPGLDTSAQKMFSVTSCMNIPSFSLQDCPAECDWSSNDLLIDAIWGTGFKGEVTGDIAQLFRDIAQNTTPVIAVDIPSGIDGETGEVRGEALQATITVTFQFSKIGLMKKDGPRYARRVIVADIGIPWE